MYPWQKHVLEWDPTWAKNFNPRKIWAIHNMAVPAIIDKVRKMKEDNENEWVRLKREREEAGLPWLSSPEWMI